MEDLEHDQEDRVGESGHREDRPQHRHPAQGRIGERDHRIEEELHLLRERPA